MQKYDHRSIEAKWQAYWLKNKIFFAHDFASSSASDSAKATSDKKATEDKKKSKKYILVEFPYPSGEGLHMGHLRPYVAADVYSRFNRLKGFKTLLPIGWDAFGLPAENYAIKMAVNPAVSTKKNVSNAKRQLQSWGMSFDWSREINTTDPNYYKWTQWLFLQFYKAGLAYEATGLINWCPKDKTGLANEEVIDGKCERCGTLVEKKQMRQWYLKITAYAEKLLEGLKHLPEWPEAVKLQQANWIGKSEGLEEYWQVDGMNIKLATFTTWPHTTWGATFMVIAPEHPIIESLVKATKYEEGAKEFIKKCAEEKIKDPLNVEKKKDGYFLGRYAINHLTGWKMPLYIANFAIMDYGTGIVKCTPTHDQRDFEFAKKYDLPFKLVIQPKDAVLGFQEDSMQEAYTGEGVMVNAGEFTGMDTQTARKAIADFTIAKGEGKYVTNYKLRDWVFSRQRYWGEPIPIVHCPKCGIVPVPEKDLPVKLPPVKNYQPTGTGDSPLAAIAKWVNVKCPVCKSSAKRETNTMPQWAGSSWYWLRYTDPKNKKSFADKKKQKYWTPVDVYFGGMEHTTLHLLYSRFWNLFLFDQGLVTSREPYTKRQPHGIILGPDGEKMSKSRGNVVNPDEIVKTYGADTLRMYELFLGPHEAMVGWNDKGVVGVKRFLDRVWGWVGQFKDSKLKIKNSDKAERALHRLIKKIGEDIENFRFNTSVSAFMEFHNEVKDEAVSLASLKVFLILLYPFAPHIAEELNYILGGKKSLQSESWPKFNPALIMEQTAEIVVQINGKVRGKLSVPTGSTQEQVKPQALALEPVKQALAQDSLKRVVFVPNRLINLVI